MKLEFKRSDFPCECVGKCKPDHNEGHYDWCPAEESAEIANGRLAEMLADAPVVYKFSVNHGAWAWFEKPNEHDTHTARLVNIEEIGK